MRLAPVLVVALLVALPAVPQAGAVAAAPIAPAFEAQSWGLEEGLPDLTIHSIVQTGDGHLWVATRAGVARFDGLVFDPPAQERALGQQFVWTVHAAHDGGLWVGSGLLGLLRIGGQPWVARRPTAAPISVRAVWEDRDGRVWVGIQNGLFEVRPGGDWRPVSGVEGEGTIRALLRDRGGRLWVGGERGLAVVTDKGLSRAGVPASLRDASVFALLEARDGAIHVGTANGHFTIAGDEAHRFGLAEGLPAAGVDALAQDGDGVVWIGTRGGLVALRDGRVVDPGPPQLPKERVTALFADREGNIWMGFVGNGLWKLVARAVPRGETGFPARTEGATIAEAADGAIWLAARGSGTFRSIDGVSTRLTRQDGLQASSVLALTAGPDGAIWLATTRGIDRWRKGAIETIWTGDAQADLVPRALLVDSAGVLWAGMAKAPLWRLDTATTAPRPPEVDPTLTDIVALTQDRAGVVWAGGDGGLRRHHAGRTTTVALGPSSPSIRALYADPRGVLWVGTSHGLVRLHGDRLVPLSADGARRYSTVSSILEDDDGNLWFGAFRGIFRLARADREAFVAGAASDPATMALSHDDAGQTVAASALGHPAAWRARDGRLWFTTRQGAVVLDPRAFRPNPLIPPVVIQSARVDGQLVTPTQSLRLRPGVGVLDLRFAVLSFVAPTHNRYRFRLEGFDREWTMVVGNGSASYRRLPHGRYRFLVAGASSDGVWNPIPATLSIEVLPYFHQTPWFIALCAAALGLAAWQGHRLYVRHLAARHAAVLAERTRVARELHDHLLQGITAVNLQIGTALEAMPANAPRPTQHLRVAHAMLDQSIEAARRYVWDLRAPAATRSDLGNVLGAAAERLTSGAAVVSDLEILGDPFPLDGATQDQLLQVGQEAITNAVRHATASRIVVSLAYDRDAIRLSVADDGRGFDPAAPPPDGHFGLVGMRERVEGLGGRIEVASASGQGTRVTVTVPMPAKGPAGVRSKASRA